MSTARMTRKHTGALVFLVSAVLTLGACAETRLPDDPDSEPSMAQELPNPEAPSVEIPVPTAPPVSPPASTQTPPTDSAPTLSKYAHLDPGHIVPTNLLEKAVLYYDSHLSSIGNKKVLSVIDFSARSTRSRFFIIDMASGSVWALHVAHGKDSDPNHDGYADSFSNVEGSNQSSLGFYKAAETYEGSHGLSLRLDGLSSTNSRARERAIVIHGADYVEEASVIQGRSWGCPAVSMGNRTAVINKIKGGSIIYAGLSAKE